MILMLACNHYRDGHFVGHFDAADFNFGNGFELYLSCNYCDVAFKCSELDVRGTKMLKVGKKTVRTYGSQDWVGNWCWCSWVIRPRAAAMLLNYLRDTKGFHRKAARRRCGNCGKRVSRSPSSRFAKRTGNPKLRPEGERDDHSRIHIETERHARGVDEAAGVLNCPARRADAAGIGHGTVLWRETK